MSGNIISNIYKLKKQIKQSNQNIDQLQPSALFWHIKVAGLFNTVAVYYALFASFAAGCIVGYTQSLKKAWRASRSNLIRLALYQINKLTS